MDIDEAWSDDLPSGVYVSLGIVLRQSSDSDDAVAVDGDIAKEPRIAGSVDNSSIRNDHIEGGVVCVRSCIGK